jgi:hypothetical protein
MGLGSSRPTSGIPGVMQFAPVTREQLLKNSAIPRLMINDIFNAMITKITPVDILDLANSNKCSAYVFAMAETLDSLFKGLKIQPRQDKTSGVIIFQKLDELKKQSDKSESRTLCLTLAYYYIRIFQIFGALALTVVDDPGSMEVLGAIQRIPLKQQVIPGRQFQPAFIGGAGGEDIQNFLPLTKVYESDAPEPLKGRRYKIFTIDHDQDSNKLYYYIDGSTYNLLREYKYYYIRAKVSIYKKNFTTLFRLENYFMEPKSEYKLDQTLINEINKKIKQSDEWQLVYENNEWMVVTRSKGEKYNFKNAIPYLFNEKDQQIKEIYSKLTTKKQTDYGTRDRDRGYGQQQYIQQSTPFETGALSTEYIRKTLESFKSTSRSSESKALSFCTARALQLLDATKIQRPTQTSPGFAISGICLPTLPSAPLSIPQPGTRLDRVPGLHALEQLYHTNYSIKEGKFQVDVPTTDQEYATFLQSISDLFGKPQQKAVSKFQDIPAADSSARCADAVKKYLQISNPKTIGEVLTIMNRMFGRQLVHTKNVIEFMRKYLINIKTINEAGAKQTIFLLNPRILQNGIAEVNQVGKMARQLLLKYYTDCETAYKQGLDIISKSTDVKAIV